LPVRAARAPHVAVGQGVVQRLNHVDRAGRFRRFLLE
jgi:hypothetical protein